MFKKIGLILNALLDQLVIWKSEAMSSAREIPTLMSGSGANNVKTCRGLHASLAGSGILGAQVFSIANSAAWMQS